MARFRFSLCAVAFSAVALAQPLYADVNAQDVWDNWRGYMSGLGVTLDYQETQSTGGLRITDFTAGFTVPFNRIEGELSMPTILFRENGDGTVSIEMPAKSTTVFSATDLHGNKTEGKAELTYDNLDLLASGAPNDIVYDYTLDAMMINLAGQATDDASTMDLQYDLTLAGLTGQSTIKTDEMRRITQRFRLERMTLVSDFSGSDDGDLFELRQTATHNNLETSSELTLPLSIELENPAQILDRGVDLKFESTRSDGTFSSAGTTNDVDVNFQGTFGRSEMQGQLNEVALSATAQLDDFVIAATTSAAPIPISGEMRSIKMGLTAPLGSSEQAQDFGLTLRLEDFRIADALWNMFDAGGALPREPLSFELDVAGQATLFKNLTSMTAQETEAPGELNALSLNQFLLRVAGAELTGVGAFTFDNSDTVSFDGLPRPEGIVDLRLLGGMGLLDNIVKLGWVGESEAMGARMMMGLFTTPGPGEDELTSQIEVNDKGHVLANGQRIR